MAQRKISRRAFGGGALGMAVAANLSAVPAHAVTPVEPEEKPFLAAPGRWSKRPNVLFILADDLGWADLSCYGSTHVDTPNLDRLAKQGVRFTNGYSGSSTCSPTRLSLYTGRYPGRIPAGLEEPLSGDGPGLEPDHPTLASLLRDAGYATAMIGKWHCGQLPNHSPVKSGWDEFFGNFGGGLEYYSKLSADDGGYDLYEGETEYQDLRYYTRILTERADEFIRRDHGAPWLLNLNFTTPHWPWIAEGDEEESARLTAVLRSVPPEQATGVLSHLDGGSLEKYEQMVEDLDRSVGEVLAALEATGQDRDTLVVFSSDNGGERFAYSWPFTGTKDMLLEGGIRVPTILRWPARFDGGQVSDMPIFTLDWTATLLEVGGASPDPAYPLDGISLAGYLLRGEELPERDLFWRQEDQRALRRGKWKYLRAEQAQPPIYNNKDLLFDLSQDRHECANRAQHEPALVAELRAAWERIDATLLSYP